MEYREVQKRVHRAIREKKNESWERTCTRINTYIGGTRITESWKTIRSLRQQNNKDIISPISLQKWDDYFSELLTEKRTEYKQQNTTDQITTISSPIIHKEQVRKLCHGQEITRPGTHPPRTPQIGNRQTVRTTCRSFPKVS